MGGLDDDDVDDLKDRIEFLEQKIETLEAQKKKLEVGVGWGNACPSVSVVSVAMGSWHVRFRSLTLICRSCSPSPTGATHRARR